MIAERRLRTQRLVGRPLARPEDVVRWLGAVQSQDYAGAKWAVAQRSRNGADAAVETAFDAGRILRTHILRSTWHFVLPEDIRWIQQLTAPRVRASIAYVDRRCEITPAIYARSVKAIAGALEGGRHLTREELAAALKRARITASGMVLGGWRRLVDGRKATVEIRLLAPLSKAELTGLKGEVDRCGRALGLPARVTMAR